MIKIVTEPLLERFKLTMDDSKNIMDKYKTIITRMKEENKTLEGVNTKLTKCTTELETCKSDLTECRTQLEKYKTQMKNEKDAFDKKLEELETISTKCNGIQKQLNTILDIKDDNDLVSTLTSKLTELEQLELEVTQLTEKIEKDKDKVSKEDYDYLMDENIKLEEKNEALSRNGLTKKQLDTLTKEFVVFSGGEYKPVSEQMKSILKAGNYARNKARWVPYNSNWSFERNLNNFMKMLF